MKHRLFIVLTTFFAIFFTSKNGFSQVTLSINNSSATTVSVSLCSHATPSFTAVTPIYNLLNPYSYTWKWYRNGAQIWTETSNSFQSILPDDEYEGIGAYRVTVVINLINTSNSNTVNVTGDGSYGEYNPASITTRLVSGDFDNDGREDDVAAFYRYGPLSTTLHVWKGNTTKFTYQGDAGWWRSFTYSAANLVGVVSGDFDNDGFKDDIAAFYNYGGTTTELHVFTGNGSSFSFASKWSSSTYSASKIALRVVSGDFDRDGFKDDIAAFYDYGSDNTTIHVWKSNGAAGFTGPGSGNWWSSPTYTASRISGRVVSGDFDSDGYEDDIVAFYGNSTLQTTAHMWSSNSNTGIANAFTLVSGSGWTSTTYESAKIAGTLVSGDFDRDGFKDDIAAFYNYGPESTTVHLWKANGTSLSLSNGSSGWWSSPTYNQSKIAYRVVSGDFDSDNRKDDITMFYDYGTTSISAHVLLSNSNSPAQSTAFIFQGNEGFWAACSGTAMAVNPESELAAELQTNVLSTEGFDEVEYTIFPNPTSGKFYISSLNENSVIEIYSVSGEKVYTNSPEGQQKNYAVNVQNLKPGIYLVKVSNNQTQRQSKIVIE